MTGIDQRQDGLWTEDGDERLAASGRGRTVSVLLPLGLPRPYDYKVPPGLDLEPGSFVVVPLGPRLLVGVVWGEGTGEVGDNRLRAVEEVLPVPPLREVSRRFIDWVAAYTLHPPGMVLRLVMRAPGALEPQRTRTLLRITGEAPARMTPARTRVLAAAADGFARTPAELADEAGASASVVKGLLEQGALEAIDLPAEAAFPAIDPDFAGKTLSQDQWDAAGELRTLFGEEAPRPMLLDGVTGSGKTEVYFEAVAEAMRRGRQALILLPEIALTSQFLERFEARFGVRPAEWHSDLGPRERRRVWRAVAEGRAGVVVGARSALFLPYADLGLIVVDEEHDAAYKQDEGVSYNARDMAVVRASLGGIPVILSSATPALETFVNAQAGRYGAIQLASRHGAAAMPGISAIDMRRDPPERGRWLSPRLVEAMIEALEQKEQILLFLNRRGYAPLTLCRACGHRMECPNCSAWLVEHRFRRELACHHCGYTAPLPRACPSCGAQDSLVACGPGVERIAEEVAERFPEARISLLSSDVLHGPRAHEEAIRQIENREIDIIIGTQIVAKGHHFPWLTLVGVIDADLGLENADLRAGERTFQLMQQVAGRAGRAERPGRVLLQTYMPEHPVMRALVAGARDSFYAREAEQRRRLGQPPFGRLAGVVVSSENPAEAQRVAHEMARRIPEAEKVQVLGPAPAPLALLRGRTRIRFLIKARREVNLQAFVTNWLTGMKVPGSVRVAIDIDPLSFL
ncbi:MAG: primosomal protein N' [Parvibaculaceae bacterium]|nr:primosomal protein N' [Parvibaculaceae bacterium]